MEARMLSDMKDFIRQCKADPSILTHPSLSFFTDYLHSVGGELPQAAYKSGGHKSAYEVDDSDDDDMDEVEEVGEAKYKPVYEDKEEDIVESDVEVEGGSVEPDNDPPQKMGDSSVEVSEENRDAAQEAKGKAMEAVSEGNYEEAIEHLTQAILLNSTSAIMYATRAKMKKPNAAIRDANAALEINPDSAEGHKSRGMARAMLGQWEVAAQDLLVASNIDYDEEISDVLKKLSLSASNLRDRDVLSKVLKSQLFVDKFSESVQHTFLDYLADPPQKVSGKGTTIVAFIYSGGIIVASDSRVTIGEEIVTIVSDTVHKVFKLGDHMLCTMAGVVNQCEDTIHKLTNLCLEFYERNMTQPVAHFASSTMVDIYKNEVLDGKVLECCTVIASCTEAEGPILYSVAVKDFLCSRGTLFTQGSGGSLASEYLRPRYHYDMSTDDAATLAIESIQHAAKYDSFTGGIAIAYQVGPFTKAMVWKWSPIPKSPTSLPPIVY